MKVSISPQLVVFMLTSSIETFSIKFSLEVLKAESPAEQTSTRIH